MYNNGFCICIASRLEFLPNSMLIQYAHYFGGLFFGETTLLSEGSC